jgi:hypothetical protein
MEQGLNMETVGKHFKEASNTTIQPGKIEAPEVVAASTIKLQTNNFWTNQQSHLQNAYLTGKLLAKSDESLKIEDLLIGLGSILIEGVKISNTKSGKTSENLHDHFVMLLSVLKVIGRDINALYEPAKRESTGPGNPVPAIAHPVFDPTIILAMLNGFVIEKVYGQNQVR